MKTIYVFSYNNNNAIKSELSKYNGKFILKTRDVFKLKVKDVDYPKVVNEFKTLLKPYDFEVEESKNIALFVVTYKN